MYRTSVSLTVLSIVAAVAAPAMAASVSSNSPRQANTITERVIPANTITERVVPANAITERVAPAATVPSSSAKGTSYPSSASSKSLEKAAKNAPVDPFTGKKLVPAQTSPVNTGRPSQQMGKNTIADELAEGVEGMAVGVPEQEQLAEESESDESKEQGPSVMDLPPFAERFPPESITSRERAEEVIEAYKREVSAINKWYSKAERPCYRSFFVNWCLSKTKGRARDKKNAAKAVWVVARDFIRKEQSDKAVAERLAKDKERAELVARIEAQAPKPKGTGLVSVEPDADIDTRGMMTVNDGRRTDVPGQAPQQPVMTKKSSQPKEPVPSQEPAVAQKPESTSAQTPQLAQEPAPANEAPKASEPQLAKEAPAAQQPPSSGQKLNLVEPRELTLEEEEANELEYERREKAREERVQKAETDQEEHTAPSTTEEERAAEREARRKAAELKRQENIRKRERKAADYEKQKKLREEQNSKKE